jgi:hypothetical protein
MLLWDFGVGGVKWVCGIVCVCGCGLGGVMAGGRQKVRGDGTICPKLQRLTPFPRKSLCFLHFQSVKCVCTISLLNGSLLPSLSPSSPRNPNLI